MKTVKIISGYYGLSVHNIMKPKSADDAPFELPDEEAKRIVDLGIAEYVDDTHAAAITEDEKKDLPKNNNHSSNDSSADKLSDEDSETAEIPDYNVNMTVTALRAIAKNAGISFRVGTTKEEMVEALDAHYADTMPDLAAESPIS